MNPECDHEGTREMRVFGRRVGFCCESCADQSMFLPAEVTGRDGSGGVRCVDAGDLSRAINLVLWAADDGREPGRYREYRALAGRLQAALDGGGS